MKAQVIYDSVFGNTGQIAQVIGATLGAQADVETLPVKDARPKELSSLKLLVVGSPTRAFRPTGAITKFLGAVPKHALEGVKVAAFDTRISTADINSRALNIMVKLFGYAAAPIAKRLRNKSGELVLAPEGFIVKDTEGPLKEGEIERAAAWAKQLIASL